VNADEEKNEKNRESSYHSERRGRNKKEGKVKTAEKKSHTCVQSAVHKVFEVRRE